MPIGFEPSPLPTIGIEEEFQLCDLESGDLVPKADEIMAAAGPELRKHLSYDLLLTLIEANTKISESVEEGIEDLVDKRRQAQALAELSACTLGMTGTHPYADPHQQRFVSTPDYQWVREQLGYVAQRNITFGLHVHIGVDDAERAVYVANRMRLWIGPLIALAANSPYLDGVDTGWDAARVYAFGAFPRAGIPEYGTVEFRACDVQISVPRTAAIVALVQALVVAYGDAHRAGKPEPYLPGAYLVDLRWKGMRFGLSADVIDAETSEVVSMPALVERMVEVAWPAATKLGTTGYLDIVSEILQLGNGAAAQRAALAEEGGDLRKLQHRLLREAVEKGIRQPGLDSLG